MGSINEMGETVVRQRLKAHEGAHRRALVATKAAKKPKAMMYMVNVGFKGGPCPPVKGRDLEATIAEAVGRCIIKMRGHMPNMNICIEARFRGKLVTKLQGDVWDTFRRQLIEKLPAHSD